jgi:hypothetical protein
MEMLMNKQDPLRDCGAKSSNGDTKAFYCDAFKIGFSTEEVAQLQYFYEPAFKTLNERHKDKTTG